ncbi:hypothetical protein HYS00_02650 [Candidatus Microgenomates bacterium]|nr:hypothetical protein [Candidatus Microgenomates bacterium]
MLTIICGEDSVKSREYLQSLIAQYKKKSINPQFVSKEDLPKLAQPDVQSMDLFGNESVYVIENLNKILGRKSAKDTWWNALEAIQRNPQVILLDWEKETSLRDLRIGKMGTVKEFKPDANVFMFVETCAPKNLERFVMLLDKVATPQNEMLIYILLTRHIRNLLLIALGDPPASLQPWQRGKLAAQAKLWDPTQLTDFYDKLLAIEVSLKSGKSIYSLKESIEIVACYYLR